MVTNKNIRLKIKKFVEFLKQDIHVDRVVLFGSYAKGKPKPYSDIDLAIFSRNFKDKDELKNMQYLFKKASAVDTAIEPHPFHPKDLKSPEKGGLLYEIIKTGKVIL